MENTTKRVKTFAKSEREKIRELFSKRAGEAPVPSPFDAESLREWDQYCEEMRDLEAQLRAAGVSL